MNGFTGTLWGQLREGAPLYLVFYASPSGVDDVLEMVRLVAPEEWQWVRTSDLESAFQKLDVPLLLIPEDEVGAVSTLEGRRDALLARTAPTILFLLKDGSGERQLRQCPALASWLQGREFDPEPAQVDVEKERGEFLERTGLSPEEWLVAWNRDEIPDTFDSNYLYQRALLLRNA